MESFKLLFQTEMVVSDKQTLFVAKVVVDRAGCYAGGGDDFTKSSFRKTIAREYWSGSGDHILFCGRATGFFRRHLRLNLTNSNLSDSLHVDFACEKTSLKIHNIIMLCILREGSHG